MQITTSDQSQIYKIIDKNRKTNIQGILFTEKQIQQKVRQLADEISKDYEEKELVVVGILKGSVIFLADLLRNLKINCKVDFMCVSSYKEMKSTGIVNVEKDVEQDIKGKDVLLIEDIVDSGCTLSNIKTILADKGANSVKICTLLNKEEARKVHVDIDYRGFSIPNRFVVGYGLDYEECYRGLPHIAVLKTEIGNQLPVTGEE